MGFFDRFYYGKAGKADFTTDDLPAGRLQLFWEVLRIRFWSLIRVNLMQLLFWLPMMIWTGLNVMVILQAITPPEGSAEVTMGMLQAAQGYLVTYAIGLIPCILITGPSTAAASYITRNWARDQHSFIWSDFKDAFKANYKQGLVASALTSVMPLLLLVGYQFYGNAAQSMPGAVAAQALLVMAVVVWALALVFIYPLMVGYKVGAGTLLRNSLLLALGRLPFALGIRLLTALPLVIFALIGLTISSLGQLVLVLYYALIGFALHRLIYSSFANAVFDKYINPRIEGAPVNMGLRSDDEDDGEDLE